MVQCQTDSKEDAGTQGKEAEAGPDEGDKEPDKERKGEGEETKERTTTTLSSRIKQQEGKRAIQLKAEWSFLGEAKLGKSKERKRKTAKTKPVIGTSARNYFLTKGGPVEKKVRVDERTLEIKVGEPVIELKYIRPVNRI